MSTGHGEFFGTEHQQEVTPHRQLAALEASKGAVEYAIKSNTHLWLVFVAHRATDVMLDAFEGKGEQLPLLDVDTIWMPPGIACFLCEASYEPRLRKRRCPGDAHP